MSYPNHRRSGHRALRRGRTSLPGHVYHVTTTTSGREPVFDDFRVARAVARCLNNPALLQDATTLCWVLMPDHLHWLLQLGERQTLSSLVRRFKAASAREVNREYMRKGVSFWAPAFHDHALRAEEDLETVARYITFNPVRARLVETPANYPHWDAAWDWDFL